MRGVGKYVVAVVDVITYNQCNEGVRGVGHAVPPTACCSHCVIRERLGDGDPTVPSFPRLSVEDTKLGEYDIPAGTLVFVTQSVLNRRPDLWGDNADEYRPDRFLSEGYSLELAQSMPSAALRWVKTMDSIAGAVRAQDAMTRCKDRCAFLRAT